MDRLPEALTSSVPARHAGRPLRSFVIPRLDLGISFQEVWEKHPDFRLTSSRQFSPGDAKIKSWHDGRVERNACVTRRSVLSWRLWNTIRVFVQHPHGADDTAVIEQFRPSIRMRHVMLEPAPPVSEGGAPSRVKRFAPPDIVFSPDFQLAPTLQPPCP